MTQPSDAAFTIGQQVRVHRWTPPGHVRTPWYVKGRVGTVTGIAGRFKDPQELAYGRYDTRTLTLYRVAFDCATIWPDDQTDDDFSLVMDLYENWLEPVEEGP